METKRLRLGQSAACFVFLFCGGCHFFDSFHNNPGPKVTNENGLVFFDRWRAVDGVNLVNDETMRTCRVIGMDGVELGNLPGGFCLFLPEGQYFSNALGPSLFDRDFNVIWSHPELDHHHEAIFDAARDRIWIFVYERDEKNGRPRIHDRLIGLDRATGRIDFSWRPEEARKSFEDLAGISMRELYSKNLKAWGITHLNSVSLVKKDLGASGKIGDLLLSDTGSIGAVYILDPEQMKIKWLWRPEASELLAKDQHSAHFLEDGRILTFVNNTGESPRFEKKSSVLALLDPVKKKIVWTYEGPPGFRFFSQWFGNVDPLPDGGILVTHILNEGSAFELNREGRLVWEWNNDATGVNGQRRQLYRVGRLSREIVEPYLSRWKKNMDTP